MTSPQLEAVLFDLGNTLVSYYKAADFYPILERSISAVAYVLRGRNRVQSSELAFERAKSFNRERIDNSVWPLKQRLSEIFALDGENFPDDLLDEMSREFLGPIFATAKPDTDAIPVLKQIRCLGLKCAIVSNTPWGSPAMLWREELNRWGLLELIDEAVFCVDVGWRKPAPKIFQYTLARLRVPGERAIFVGDDVRWDVDGARGAGIVPVLLSGASSVLDDYSTVQRLGDLIPMLRRDFTCPDNLDRRHLRVPST
jgi:putative hydrolase of the HAD superfamily